jgi:DNA-binding XRE family transcriptional regulator
MKNTGALNPALLDWSFADRLRKVRRDVADATQEEFAAALDVPLKAYGAWEAGRNTPREVVAIAKRIELVTGVPAAWMLGLDTPFSPARTGTDDHGSRTITQYFGEEFASVVPLRLVSAS